MTALDAPTIDTPTIATPSPIDRTVTQIIGYLAHVKYRSDTNYVIAQLVSGEAVKGEWDSEADTFVGEKYRFFGEWKEDDKWGAYFAFNHVCPADVVRSPSAVIRYLMGFQITLSKAQALNRRFGPDTIDVCRSADSELERSQILTIDQSVKLRSAIIASAKFQEIRIELTGLFAGRGFQREAVHACIKTWGTRAVEVVKRDPFKMLVANIPSAGFKRCDKLWTDDIAKPKNALRRQFFCAWDALRGLDGDTWAMQGVIFEALAKQFGDSAKPKKVIEMGVRAKWFERRVVEGGKMMLIAERGKAEAERRVVTQLQWLMGDSE